MDTSSEPSPSMNLSSVATMEKALQFVNAYLSFASEVPAAAQKAVSLYKELQAATGENIKKLKELMSRQNRNDLASKSNFDLLVQMSDLMEETKHLNQEKIRLAAEIEEIITEGACEVEARRKELVESKDEQETIEAEPEIVQAEPEIVQAEYESPARRTTSSSTWI